MKTAQNIRNIFVFAEKVTFDSRGLNAVMILNRFKKSLVVAFPGFGVRGPRF